MSTTSKAILHRDVHSVIDADMSLDDARAAFWRMIPKEFHVTFDSLRKSSRSWD